MQCVENQVFTSRIHACTQREIFFMDLDYTHGISQYCIDAAEEAGVAAPTCLNGSIGINREVNEWTGQTGTGMDGQTDG